MKTYLVLFTLFIFRASGSNFNLKEQLKNVNPYWEYHSLTEYPLEKKHVFASDAELIQLHLQFVENALRKSPTEHLNKEQRKQRSLLLDALHNYRTNGLFPKNTSHEIRTPYFIDKYGTACAVGYLIINSGSKNLALQISKENNNAYLFDLSEKYPQVKQWAIRNGFALDELAWIQPCYTPAPDTAGLKQPTCHNARNGYFCPDLDLLKKPLTKKFYRLEQGNWTPWVDMCGDWLFHHLQAGKYLWEIKDSLNATHNYTTELIAPEAAKLTTVLSGNFNSCNGIVTVSVQGGIPPFKYSWSSHTATTSILNSVCEENIILTFFEHGGFCHQFKELLTGTVGLKEELTKKLNISPNPVKDILSIQSEFQYKSVKNNVQIFNIQGETVLKFDLQNGETKIDVSTLPVGLYFVQLDNYCFKRFIKE